MSRNEIRLDQIQQRLGGSNKSRQTQFDEYGYAIPEKPFTTKRHDNVAEKAIAERWLHCHDCGCEPDSWHGDILFHRWRDAGLGFGLGGFGGSTEAVASGSVLDPVCGKGWQADDPNTDQMHCYLTRQVYRLCDKDEHVALLATIKQYDKDYQVWHRKFMVATFKSIGKLQTQGLQLGMEAAKLENMKGDDKNQVEQFNKVTGIAGDIMKPANDMLATRVNKVPEYELETPPTSWSRADTSRPRTSSRSKPEFIANALKRAGKVKTACPNRES